MAAGNAKIHNICAYIIVIQFAAFACTVNRLDIIVIIRNIVKLCRITFCYKLHLIIGRVDSPITGCIAGFCTGDEITF